MTLDPNRLALALMIGCLTCCACVVARASPRTGTPAILVAETDPSRCGLATPSYGTIVVGSIVSLARHSAWMGASGPDDNWNEAMDPFVGRLATVERLSGLDDAGCAGVRVDLDHQEWFWRVRDLAHGSSHGVLRN